MKLEIFDSTLRDGAQSEGISFSVLDKVNILSTLDGFGVAYVEAGNPGSNPKDLEFFKKAAGMSLKHARLCAFGSTRRKDTETDKDANLQSLLAAETPAVAIFGKAWELHIRKILGITPDENLKLISDTISYLKARGKEVIFDAEHFFDGFKASEEYAMKVLYTAKESGADVLVLCDTNGGALPFEVENAAAKVASRFSGRRVGIHCHNDSGCAVANTLSAVKAGAMHVQGTFIGIGERCGNADLSVLIPDLQLKMGMRCIEGELSALTSTAYRISEICNVSVPAGKPYTGASAFAHKGGMHIDGVCKFPGTFEHVEPESVGNKRRLLMSEVSGRTTVLAKIDGLAPELTKDSPETAKIVKKLKEMEHEGYQFESADASFELLVLNQLGRFKPHFKLNIYKTSGEYPAPDGDMSAYAMIKLEKDGKSETAASTGNGPVNALDQALRRALKTFYPELEKVHLIDYKVRVLTAEDATAAKVRVLIDSSDGERVWTTVGVSTDIIQASWIALADSIEYILYKNEVK